MTVETISVPVRETAATNELLQLQEVLRIDEENLAGEWHRQPELYVTAARIAARYEAALALAELECKEVEARLYRDVRIEPREGKRLSEEAVKQAIRLDPTWQQTERHRIDCLELSKIAAGIVRAAEQRERSLKWITIRRYGEWDGRDSSLPPDQIESTLRRAVSHMRGEA